MFKLYQDFIKALNQKYGCSDKSELSGLNLQHYTFAASTNGRGLNAIGAFEAYGFSMSGLKILDVGCAYGGFSIEAARKGAHCYGVEISPPLYEFALLNSQGETYDSGSAAFVLTDATSPDFLKKMPHNYFDLIIVNDVFEHVYDTVQLLSNLAEVANAHCAIYFVIPNGNDLRFIAKEGHSGHCGISLLWPLFWHTMTGDKLWNVYYRQYEYYQALFSHFGFHVVDFINYPGHIGLSEIKERISCEYEITKQTIAQNEPNFPKAYASKLRSALKGFENQMQYDLKQLDAPKLAWKYLTKFWSGFAQRQALGLEPPSQTTERRFDSDEDDFGVRFVLSRKENLLSIDVVTEFPSEGLDFAFHLMRRGESIERSHYQRQPRYEWSLEAPGMYSAAIYVKRKEQEHKDYRILTQPLYFAGKVL